MPEKTFDIDPILFTGKSSGKRATGAGTKPKKSGSTKPLSAALKQSIIRMLRQHSHQKERANAAASGGQNTSDAVASIVGGRGRENGEYGGEDDLKLLDESEFAQSLDFLTKLSESVQERDRSPAHPTQLVVSSTPSQVPLTGGARPGAPGAPQPPPQPVPVYKSSTINNGALYNRAGAAPLYGALKQGTLPTYRNWFNRSIRAGGGVPPPYRVKPTARPTPVMPMSESQRAYRNQLETNIKNASHAKQLARLNELYRESASRLPPPSTDVDPAPSETAAANPITQPVPVRAPKYRPIQKRTVRRIFQVGKHKTAQSVTVLLSNRSIRAHTTLASQRAKQVPMQDVRKYLIQRKLIQPGTIVPNDILRKMYETSHSIVGDLRGAT